VGGERGGGQRRIDEVGAGDVEVAQLVHGVFVEVGEQRGALPGEAAVERGELFVAGGGREVGDVVLHGVGDEHAADEGEGEQRCGAPSERADGQRFQRGHSPPRHQYDGG
jgi:hypothetical protein